MYLHLRLQSRETKYDYKKSFKYLRRNKKGVNTKKPNYRETFLIYNRYNTDLYNTKPRVTYNI